MRAQLAALPTPTEVPLTSDELHHYYRRRNERRTLPPDRADNTIVNLVIAEERWPKICVTSKDPKGRGWKTVLEHFARRRMVPQMPLPAGLCIEEE